MAKSLLPLGNMLSFPSSDNWYWIIRQLIILFKLYSTIAYNWQLLETIGGSL